MAYATSQDLVDRYGDVELRQVADRDHDGMVDTAVVDAALADATEVIESYLGGRYALPISPVPGIVKEWCCDLARARLHKDDPPPVATAAVTEAMRQLRDAQAGRLVLQVAGIAATDVVPSTAGGVLIDAPERHFDMTTLGAF